MMQIAAVLFRGGNPALTRYHSHILAKQLWARYLNIGYQALKN